MSRNSRSFPSMQFVVKYKSTLHPEIEHLSEDEIIDFISDRLCGEVMKKLDEFNQDNLEDVTNIAFNITRKYLNCGYEIEFMALINEIPNDN